VRTIYSEISGANSSKLDVKVKLKGGQRINYERLL